MTRTTPYRTSIARRLLSRMLHTYFLMSRGLTIGVRAIVRSDDGKFLLVRHTYTPGWHFPGGGVEKGETAKHALEKELRQEAGLKLSGHPLLHGVFHNHGVSKRDHVLAYVCAVDGALENKPSSMEIAEIGYYDLGNLPKGVHPGTERRMREITEGAAPEETW